MIDQTTLGHRFLKQTVRAAIVVGMLVLGLALPVQACRM
jgi:hypothetical protein